VRTRIRVGLTAFCLGLLGCTSAGHKPDAADSTPRPFTGTTLTRPATRDPGPPPEVDNLLAGQVLDKAFNKRVSNASIQVVDLQDANPAPAARLDVAASNDGYFFIPGLQRGHHYQLIARIKDGNRILSGTTLAMPPNPRLSIYLSEDFTSPSTPAPLGPPTAPSPPAADKDKTPAAPSAALDAPTKPKPDGAVDTTAPSPPAFNKIAEDTESGGFQKIPPAPLVVIPFTPPAPVIPPPPPFRPSGPLVAPPAPPIPPSQQAIHEAPPRTSPPFCVLVGNRLDDFALTGLDGKPWEFRRDPPRKLVLLDFWKSNCSPCLAAVAHLRGMQETYRRDGLEVVGVAYEDPAPLADQIMNVRQRKSQFKINYTVLMGADSAAGPCPVRSQFMVDSFPRLVLIDETGEILWRSSAEGLSDPSYKELEMEIYRKFHPPSR
jgi:thiol-disulfide isomerase/thioredoxin